MSDNYRLLTLSVCLVLFCLQLQGQPVFPYQDPSAPVETRTEDLLQRMTLEEKIDMLGGYEGFYIRPNERLGIPKIKMADGPLGVRNYGKATAFPGGIAFAATWDTLLVRRYGEAVGTEARSKGVHIMLAPGVNIYRAPMCGRNFEYYGEDPFLASRMAVAYIRGVQSREVMATIKHFAANNQEWDRNGISSDMDERTLREIYLPVFQAAVEEARVGAVMNSYNLVNGTHTSQHTHLIREILKGDWRFDGILMSDWGSTYDGIAAANAGLDLEMPAGDFMNRGTLITAIGDGRIQQGVIDDKVRRMLRQLFRFGFFDRPQSDSTLPLYPPESRLIALQAAREGIVLLKNSDGLLPLDPASIRTLAVIGPDAHPAVPGGGGSSIITPYRSVSFLDGILSQAGDRVTVFYSPGLTYETDEMVRNSLFLATNEKGEDVRGLRGEYFATIDMSGEPMITRIDPCIQFDWQNYSPAAVIPADSFSVRWTGKIHPTREGDYYFFVSGNNGFRLYLDDRLILDEWTNPSFLSKNTTVFLGSGRDYRIRLEYYENRGEAQITLGYRPVAEPKSLEAVRLAASCDAVVVCVGFNPSLEGENFDRPFGLPAEQVALIREVSRVNPKTIVVVTAGGNVDPAGWLDQVNGYLHAWYPGQEGGTALAEILFGSVNPSGKLPVSFEKRWEDNAAFHSYYDPDKDGHVFYSEGLFTGYRHFDRSGVEPLFPFGFGLSYTTFSYSDISVTRKSGEDLPLKVVFSVTNTGDREGDEVAQLYIRDVASSLARPVKELKGFSRISLQPGERKEVTLELPARAFQFYDPVTKGWSLEPGEFEILVGASSGDIRLRKVIRL